jgi:glycosyltransferase involved in cell wall biosynthesis
MSKTNKKIRMGIIGPCPPPYGGVTRVIANHLENWGPEDIECLFIPLRVPAQPQPPPGAVFINYREYPGSMPVPVHRFIPYFLKFPVSKPGIFSQFYKYNCALAKVIQDHKLNLLYAHHTDITGLSAILQARLHGIPCVIVSYGQTWLVTKTDRRFRRMAEFVLKNASWVISTSEHCKKGGVQLGADPDRYSVVYAGIDLEKFRPDLDGIAYRGKHEIPLQSVVVSILGLALRQKIDVFIDAVRLLGDRQDVCFLIGGIGADYEYLQTQVRAMGRENIRLMGFVPEEDLPSFYAATDILVASPHTMTECMGQSIKEAMSCSRPAVVADIGGGPEVISHMQNGLLFRPGAPEDLKDALETLIGDASLRKKMGENAARTASGKFNAVKSAEETLKIFRDLLQTSRQGSN